MKTFFILVSTVCFLEAYWDKHEGWLPKTKCVEVAQVSESTSTFKLGHPINFKTWEINPKTYEKIYKVIPMK